LSKLNDFYEKAHADAGLQAEIDGAHKGFEQNLIAIAKKHGVTLSAADFAQGLSDDELAGMAGGGFYTGYGRNRPPFK
jgi:predicted ribosomally synthesized peptide with nif11-like leader